MQRAQRHRGYDPDQQAVYTRRRFLVAGAAVAVPLGAWQILGRAAGPDGLGPPMTSPPSPATAPQVPPNVPAGTAAPASTAASTSATLPVLDHDLVQGMAEPKVGIMQQRLTDLTFDPGPVDGYFGAKTLQSVWAFQKVVMGTPRDAADGVVTPAVWDRLHGPVDVTPRRTPGGRHLEVYLPEQVAGLFHDAQPRVISHVSSGAGVEWCDEVEIDLDDGTTETNGICGLSITPGGVYHFERKVDGWRNAKLGRLYKPVYFNYGIAIHGATEVPNYPASRGCVRYPMHIADYIADLVEIGDAVYVFDGVDEPEHYGAQPMIFDWPDPNYTTTTSTTTTSTTTTITPTTSTTVPDADLTTTTQAQPPNSPTPTTTTSPPASHGA